MYRIEYGNKFKRSYENILHSGKVKIDDLNEVVRMLAMCEQLPIKFKDHSLKGDMLGYRECHLKGDCLLIYEIRTSTEAIRLINIGNHANLFE